MADDNLTPDELDELTRARKPSTQKELTEKARQYILQKAKEADEPPETRKRSK